MGCLDQGCCEELLINRVIATTAETAFLTEQSANCLLQLGRHKSQVCMLGKVRISAHRTLHCRLQLHQAVDRHRSRCTWQADNESMRSLTMNSSELPNLVWAQLPGMCDYITLLLDV